jgi:sec-independent protein translocase protein TatA
MQFGLPEIAIIGVIVLLLFGVGRIGKVGGELGRGIKEFRQAVRDDSPAPTETAESKPAA